MKSGELSCSLALVVLSSFIALYTFLAINGGRHWGPASSSSSHNPPAPAPVLLLRDPCASSKRTSLSNIAFGIAAGAEVWEERKGYIKTWWRPDSMRGAVWLDAMVPLEQEPQQQQQERRAVKRGRKKSKRNKRGGLGSFDASGMPSLMVSGDTSGFSYTFPGRGTIRQQRQQLRICRVVVDTFRLGLPDVHWFVVGDDDTVFVVDNLVAVLSKYDHRQHHYIGAISETHRQNTADPCCTGNMAYGGAGYAISYSLAAELNATLDACMHRYPDLYGGSTRIHACLLELGVPLTREPGFHQLDIGGDASGLLCAHPIAPLLSLHHIDRIEPLFPGRPRQGSLEHLFRAVAVDPSGVLQQSLCYSAEQRWSVQVAWGYAVQVTRQLLPPRVLELPLRTFNGWGVRSLDESFSFRTRALPNDSCEWPVTFYMTSVLAGEHGTSISRYTRSTDACPRLDALSKLVSITVTKEAAPEAWFQAPTRQCCRIASSTEQSLELQVTNCRSGEITAANR